MDILTGIWEQMSHLETVRDGETIDIRAGQTVLFGSDPRISRHTRPGVRNIKLDGVPRRQLSATALEIAVDFTGKTQIIPRTDNNKIDIWFQDFRPGHSGWGRWNLPTNVPFPKSESEQRMAGKDFIPEITTADDTLIRLTCAGTGGKGKEASVSYRIEINPQHRDLNQN